MDKLVIIDAGVDEGRWKADLLLLRIDMLSRTK